jgi:hypothetical protein
VKDNTEDPTVCEIKYTNVPFIIDKQYAEKLISGIVILDDLFQKIEE